MKKAFGIVAILLMVLMLTSCGDLLGGGTGGSGAGGSGSGSGSGAGGSGSGGAGGNGGSGSDGADLAYKLPETYKMTYEFTDSYGNEESETYIKTDKGFMFGDDIIYMYDDALMGFFYYDKDENTVDLDRLYTDSTVLETLESAFSSWLGYYGTYKDEDGFRRAGKAKIAGRDCTKYEYTLSVYTASVTYAFWVDDEYDICMKYYVAAEDSTGANSMTFEVTEFKTSGVSLPCTDNDYTSQIDDYIDELFEAYAGSWSEVEIDSTTEELVPVSSGKKVTISDNFKMNYDGTEYKLEIQLSAFVVKENGDIKFRIAESDDILFIIDSSNNPTYFSKDE